MDWDATHTLKVSILPAHLLVDICRLIHALSLGKRDQQRFPPIPIDDFEHRYFDGIWKGVCPFRDCEVPILSLIDLSIHVRIDHSKEMRTTATPAVQCHRCMDIIPVVDATHHLPARCLAHIFPDHLGKRTLVWSNTSSLPLF